MLGGVNKMKMNKKGMIGLQDIMGIGLAIGLGIMVVAVIAITLTAFASSQANNTSAYTVITNGNTFLTNFTSYLGTAGTIAGVMVLLGIVLVGVGGGYMLAQNFRGKNQ
jgi:hypothetical protein